MTGNQRKMTIHDCLLIHPRMIALMEEYGLSADKLGDQIMALPKTERYQFAEKMDAIRSEEFGLGALSLGIDRALENIKTAVKTLMEGVKS